MSHYPLPLPRFSCVSGFIWGLVLPIACPSLSYTVINFISRFPIFPLLTCYHRHWLRRLIVYMSVFLFFCLCLFVCMFVCLSLSYIFSQFCEDLTLVWKFHPQNQEPLLGCLKFHHATPWKILLWFNRIKDVAIMCAIASCKIAEKVEEQHLKTSGH